MFGVGAAFAWMPERSKGADLRSAGRIVRVGSNPTSGMSFALLQNPAWQNEDCMPPLGFAPRLTAPQAVVLLLYYGGESTKWGLYLSSVELSLTLPDVRKISGRPSWLDGRAVQGASFRHWSLRRREFKSPSNHFFDGALVD